MTDPIIEQYALDGRQIKRVALSMRFDDGSKVRMDVSGRYARRVLRALAAPDDDPLWKEVEE